MLKFNDKPKFEDLKQDLLMMYYVYNFIGNNGNTLETEVKGEIEYEMKPLLSMMGEDSKDFPSFVDPNFSFSNDDDWMFYADMDDNVISLIFVHDGLGIFVNDINYCIEMNTCDKTIRESWSITANPGRKINGYNWNVYEYKYRSDDDGNIICYKVSTDHSDY